MSNTFPGCILALTYPYNAALVCYEYLITVSEEISIVWQQKFTPATLLLVSTRWAILIETILQLLPATADVRQKHPVYV